jgi:hypothetical protein
MLKLSPYSIAIYQQCPKRYKYQFIDRLIQRYRKPWPWLTMGANVHAALTDFFSITPASGRTPAAIEDLLRKSWRRNREGFADTQQEREYGERAIAQLRRFAETQKVGVQPLMVERFHEAPVSEGIVLMGRIDRLAMYTTKGSSEHQFVQTLLFGLGIYGMRGYHNSCLEITLQDTELGTLSHKRSLSGLG